MPNMLPFLLIGGAVAAVVASGKKTGGKPGFSKYIRVGPGCKAVYIEGVDVFNASLAAQEKGEMLAGSMREAVQKATKEEIFPLIDELELSQDPLQASMQLLRATFPSCSFSVESLKKGMMGISKKNIKSKSDALRALKPLMSRFLMWGIMVGAYFQKMVADGKLTQEEAEDLAKGLGEKLGEQLRGIDTTVDEDVFGSPLDLDPNMIAMRRPSLIDRAVMLSL